MANPEALHPALWRADQIGAGRTGVTPSGFAALDAQLPGGGWPHQVLTELLLPHPGLGELRLLAPALATAPCVMLFEPPAALCGWGLGQLGLDVGPWLIVQGREALDSSQRRSHHRSPSCSHHRQHNHPGPRPDASADVLWALEQALRSGHLGAALAWLPAHCGADVLRRLQLAAQAHDGPVFLFRGLQARSRPSVAPLRLVLAPAGIDGLAVELIKRRGPRLAQALYLALPPVLGARQRDRARGMGPAVVPAVVPLPAPHPEPQPTAHSSAHPGVHPLAPPASVRSPSARPPSARPLSAPPVSPQVPLPVGLSTPV